MYILISIGINGIETNCMCSRYKIILVQYLKRHGYYWSKKSKRYIDDKNSKIKGGSGSDYIIERIEEL